MPTKTSNCPHVGCIDGVTWDELRLKQSNSQQCQVCGMKSANLWLCLVGACQFVGCGETHKDHSADHAQEKNHCMTINLTTLRIWCTICETEVFPGPNRNIPQLIIPENSASVQTAKQISSGNSGSMFHRVDSHSADSSPHRSLSGAEDSESDMDEENSKPRGLTGLQNLGNTCYLNAALQSLSNCSPLTRYFLDCSGFVRPEKTPKLAVAYMKLVYELWHKKSRSYVVPSSVVNGIKIVHPMFRGYSQQDSQEFLRCFMDEIHEELKQPVVDDDSGNDSSTDTEENSQSPDSPYLKHHGRQLSIDSNSSSQSEDFYETCDSGLSSDKASTELSDDSCEVTERTRLNNPDADNQSTDNGNSSRSRQTLDTDSAISSNTSRDSVVTSKSKKEKANKISKNAGTLQKDTLMSENSDALSDSEVVSKRKTGSVARQRSKSENIEAIQSQKILQAQNRSFKEKTARKKMIHYRSIISDIFDGKILSSVQCLTCERVSTTRETFQDLSLPIPSKDHVHMIHSSPQLGPPSKGGACGEAHQGWISWMFSWMKSLFVGPTINLQDCLAAFFSADELKGDNMYSCEKCKKLRNGIKYSRVLELPEILSIHLKRFRHEFYSSKISTYVSFPLDSLDMKPYLHKDCKSEVLLYDLVAVICHHGTAGGGHYTAYCLNAINDLWYEFDDQYVTEVDISQVINCEAYVLFYKKRDDDAAQLRQKAMQLLEAREPSLLQFFISKEWINRFNTFSEPGPITNSDFLCAHGGVPPDKVNHVEELVIPFNQSMWDFLHGRFGGGPVCNHLYPCSTCQKELEQLQNRQKSEIESFIQLNDQFRDEDNPPVIYYISMAWFKEWENFVRGKTNTPPGPIENSRISVTKNGQLTVKHNSDHGQLSKDMWQFLYGIYGGGPELSQKQSSLLQTGSSGGGTSSTPQDKNNVSSTTQEKPVSSTSAIADTSATQSSNSTNSLNQSSAVSSTSDADSMETESDGSRSQTESNVKDACAESTIATKL